MHQVRLDSGGKLLAWGSVQSDAYDQVLALASTYLVSGVPRGVAGLPLYLTYSYGYPGNPVTPAGWPHNPAGLYAMLTESGLAYAAYSGNPAIMAVVGNVLKYQLDYGMTPLSWAWGGIAYASADGGALLYQGAQYGDSRGVGDGVGVIQPDKVGEIGAAFLKYYQYSGETRFRDAAIQAADVLASQVRTGDGSRSPWPFRVYAQTNSVREQYTANVIAPIRLFDELVRLSLGDVNAYRTARQTAWDWLMQYPIRTNAWSQYFEDVPIQSGTANTNQLVAGETARYLMQHPEFDASWETHVRGIIRWIETTFGAQQFGATTIAEQQAFYYAMGSHTARYASLNAQLYELTGDQAALEKAFRSFNWATYMCGPDGVVIDGPAVNHVWWTDGYGDYIRHFIAGLGAVPAWAPANKSRLLRSSSVIRHIQYSSNEVTYQVADHEGDDVLKLAFTPLAVTADGRMLPNRTSLGLEGWTWDGAAGVLRVQRGAGANIRVTGEPDDPRPQNQPPQVALGSPAPGSYTSAALALSATATDPDGSIARVEFAANGTVVGSATLAPYAFTWANVAAGTYVLTATAIDDQGARTTSTSATVVIAPSSPVNGISIDAMVYSDGAGARTSPALSTTTANPLLLAFVSSDGPRSSTQSTTVSGGGLTWTLVARANSQPGAAEVWRAVSSNRLTNITVRATPAVDNYHHSLTVVAFAGATGTEATATASGSSGAPSLSVRTTTAGSLLFAVGSDWDRASARTLGPGQTMTHEWVNTTVGDTFWVQRRTEPTSAAGTAVTVGTTAPTSGRWNLVGVEVVGAEAPTSVAVPDLNSKNELEARALLTAAGLALGAVTTQPNVTAPVGAIVGQTPAAGTQVNSGSAVSVLVSAGVTVPNVVGQAQGLASALLAQWNLTVGAVTQLPSATAPAGTVIAQDPVAGAERSGGSTVTLTVSSGVATVPVPGLVGSLRAAAESTLVATGLVAGTVTNQVSATPKGSVIAQMPAAGVTVAIGSAVNLVVSSGPPVVGGPQVDRIVFSDGTGSQATPAFSTEADNQLLLAFVAADSPASGSQTLTVSGAGLSWNLVRRANGEHGASEIWRAMAPRPLTNVTVTSVPTLTGYRQSLTVVAFKGASGVGAVASASGSSGAPAVTLITTAANSLVYGVGNDWDRAVARTLPSDQAMVRQVVDTSVGDTFWVQSGTSSVANPGTALAIQVSAPTNDRWNLVGVEVVP